MIYTTQGHEHGIGLEVFLKSLISINPNFTENFILICFKDSLRKTLSTLDYKYEIVGDNLFIENRNLALHFCKSYLDYSQSIISLNKALELAKTTDLIHTLPSSKESFKMGGLQYRGHTDYLESIWKAEIAMCFLGPEANFLLLTDHIPLDQVYKSLKEKDLSRKILNAIKFFPKNRKITELFIAGINPHMGEGGLISNQDTLIFDLKDKTTLPTSVHSGDTMHFNIKGKHQLFIYPSHDQGLGVFKALYGLKGINFSAGYPIKRVSVDHGTAFDLFGKNRADYSGMKYLLEEIINW